MSEERYMLGKESKITSSSLSLLLISTDQAPGEVGVQRHQECFSAWGRWMFHGVWCRGGEGACSYMAGGSASTGWNHKNNKFFPKSLSYRKYPMNWRMMWWDVELRAQTWCCLDLLLRGLDVFPMSWCTWFWAERRTSEPLHHSRAEISCSIVKPRGYTSGWREVLSTWAPQSLDARKVPCVPLKRTHRTFHLAPPERWWGLAELALCLAYSKLME